MAIPRNDIMSKLRIFEMVMKERKRQDQLFGERNDYTPDRWLVILSEELGEVSKSILDNDLDNYRVELVQVAAVAVAALENLLRNGDKHEDW